MILYINNVGSASSGNEKNRIEQTNHLEATKQKGLEINTKKQITQSLKKKDMHTHAKIGEYELKIVGTGIHISVITHYTEKQYSN